MSARSSESGSPEQKKKSKKDKKGKKEKEKEKEKKEKPKEKEKKDKDKKRKRGDEEDRNHGASGLLDAEDSQDEADPMPPPRHPPSRYDIQREAPRADPSRSRDEPREAPRGSFDGLDDGYDGKGKGKGKDRGKGKDGGKDGGKDKGGLAEGEEKEEPNFEASGLLAVEDNAKNGVPLKFTVPAEARAPSIKWRFYVFQKKEEAPKIMHIHRNVGYLFGKDRRVADIPTDHPTCSKQHAVLHHRQMPTGEVKPYIMDLESINGTFLNGKRIEAARYIEMRESDVLKFGMSSREFVLLHGGSANGMYIDPKALRSPEEE